MREISEFTNDAWLSGDYVGERRAFVRATLQRLHMLLVPHGRDKYASAIFGQNSKPAEIPNLKSVHWERTVDIDAATCDIVLYNAAPLTVGDTPVNNSDLGQPGYYTYEHGLTEFSQTRWGHERNGWAKRMVPDAIIRTYEGYGFDRDYAAEDDPHLYQSGVWIIDKINYTTDGLIRISCRDAGRLLIDQMAFPPVVPFKKYPLHFKTEEERTRTHREPVEGDGDDNDAGSLGWKRPAYDTDSNVEGGYVSPSGDVYGHHGTDAFDQSGTSYWLSIGNARPNAGYSFEYIQGKMSARTVGAIKFTVWGGPYRVYVSLKTASDGWVGNKIVPYDPDNPASAPNGSDIRFLFSTTVEREGTYVHNFGSKHVYDDVVAVRLTFTKLSNSGLGPYPYRAGVRNFKVLADHAPINSNDDPSPDTVEVTETYTVGNYNDYTDIVKKLCAYAGLYWPRSNKLAFYRQSDDTVYRGGAPSDDPALGKGRVWGDFMQTGTAGIADIGPDVFDKKPLMDGVTFVKETIAFNFFIDETGGAVWRMPNIFRKGNYVGDRGQRAGHTTDTITIDERYVISHLDAEVSSHNVRERVFIANSNGRFGAVVKGHNPYPSGLRRVGGWTDQHFRSQDECERMADMIALRQLFTFRTDRITIPGNPAIQIDDQVKVFERITNEGYRHYILGVTMDWDLESGRYTYELSTHWLGEEPFGSWVFDPANLKDSTKLYLRTLGAIDDDDHPGTFDDATVGDPVVFTP